MLEPVIAVCVVHYFPYLTLSQADRTRLGELLLAGASTGDRLVCALIVKVEERELLQVGGAGDLVLLTRITHSCSRRRRHLRW